MVFAGGKFVCHDFFHHDFLSGRDEESSDSDIIIMNSRFVSSVNVSSGVRGSSPAQIPPSLPEAGNKIGVFLRATSFLTRKNVFLRSHTPKSNLSYQRLQPDPIDLEDRLLATRTGNSFVHGSHLPRRSPSQSSTEIEVKFGELPSPD